MKYIIAVFCGLLFAGSTMAATKLLDIDGAWAIVRGEFIDTLITRAEDKENGVVCYVSVHTVKLGAFRDAETDCVKVR